MATHLKGYFEYLGDKTYIDKYPTTIITLESLRDSKIFEMGAGVLNDLLFLIKKRIVPLENIAFSEPHIPAFVEALDKIEALREEGYAFTNRNRLRYRPFPDREIPPNTMDFFYVNNVLHSLGYVSWIEALEDRLLKEGEIVNPSLMKHIQHRQTATPESKIKEVLRNAHKILKQEGVFFGRNLANYVDESNLAKLRAQKNKTQTEIFTTWTAEAVLNGTLVGLCPKELSVWAKEIGFTKTYTEEEKRDQIKPRINFYFRFQK